jgi:hypothetical protein
LELIDFSNSDPNSLTADLLGIVDYREAVLEQDLQVGTNLKKKEKHGVTISFFEPRTLPQTPLFQFRDYGKIYLSKFFFR